MMRKFLATILWISILGMNVSPVLAQGCCKQSCEQVLCQEHLDINKNAPNNLVTITNYRKIICKDNVIAVEFDCKFSSKKACAGDVINFTIPEALYTKEGTMILPCGTKIVAEIIKNQKPKWFNKNARVSLIFRCIVFPDGRTMPICAKPFTKDGTLKEGPWMTTGKIVLSTVTLGIIGAGAGVGFGFIPSPTKIGVGLAAGIPTGAGIGLLSALISKGLLYKAKAGEQIFIIFTSDATICN